MSPAPAATVPMATVPTATVPVGPAPPDDGAARVDYPTADGHRPALVYRPAADAGSAGAPMVLDLHGGAWTWFDAAVDALWCRALADAGHLVVSAGFTSSLEAPWPAGLDDVRHAAAWMRREAGTLGGDPDRLAVVGGSTGGHLATMVGLQGDTDGRRPEAVVALWPIVDVAGRYEMVRGAGSATEEGPSFDSTSARLDALADLVRRRPAIGYRVGAVLQWLNVAQGLLPPARRQLYRRLRWAHERTFPGGIDQMRAASPVELLAATPDGGPDHRGLPPILVVHAARDNNTTWTMSKRLVDLWRAAGGEAQLDTVAGVGHSFGNVASHQADDLVDAMRAFLARTGMAP